MATNIREITNSVVLLQRGNGIPTHISPRSTLFFDLDAPTIYINKDGVATWDYLLDSSTTISGGTSSGDTYITGFTYDNSNNLTLHRNDNVNLSVNMHIFTAITATTISATTYYGDGSNLTGISASGTFTGGTVNGATRFTNGLSATTISATTYYNLPIDVFVTGGTYSNGSAIFRNNTGGTFTVTGFTTGSTASSGTFTGGTVSGATNFLNGITATTVSATTYYGIPYEFGVSLDGQSGYITTGNTSYKVMTTSGIIKGWNVLTTSATGSVIFDVWKSSGGTLPTVVNSITDAQKPQLNNSIYSGSTSINNWSGTTFNAGDIFGFNVDSISRLTKVNLTITCLKS